MRLLDRFRPVQSVLLGFEARCEWEIDLKTKSYYVVEFFTLL